MFSPALPPEEFVQNPPTDKQINFATRLANERDISIPQNAIQNMNDMSRFIGQLLQQQGSPVPQKS